MKLGQKVAIGVLSVTFLSCLFILLTDTDTTAAGNRLEELQHENADLKLRLTHALRQGQLTTALSRAHAENSHTSPPASAALPEEGRCPSPNSVVVGFVCGYGPLAEAVGDEPVPKESWYQIHQQFELALKSILINTKRNVTVVGAMPSMANCNAAHFTPSCLRALWGTVVQRLDHTVRVC
jgi:hypothetical protein